MEVRIRPILEKDAKDLQEIRLQRGVMENLLSIPTEPIVKHLDFIENVDGVLNHVLVAEITLEDGDTKAVGSVGLHINSNPRTRHVAELGIMVNENFHNMGIGTKLLESILDVSDNWLMLIRVELDVFAENKKAISFYKRFGFELEGLKMKSSIRNGKYSNEYTMARVK